MSGDVILMGFLGIATVFLYAEKIRFAPPTGVMLWAWRLIYFGAALAFFVAGVFFQINKSVSELAIGRSLLLTSLFISGAMIFIGFVLFFWTSKRAK